jgi:hypothetical protein
MKLQFARILLSFEFLQQTVYSIFQEPSPTAQAKVHTWHNDNVHSQPSVLGHGLKE